jgi:hypothetical protein
MRRRISKRARFDKPLAKKGEVCGIHNACATRLAGTNRTHHRGRISRRDGISDLSTAGLSKTQPSFDASFAVAPGPNRTIYVEETTWWAGAGQERRLVPQQRALSEIGPMSAAGLALPFHSPAGTLAA